MNELKFNFDDNFQLGVFELMMEDSTFCSKAIVLLKPEFFKNEFYSWFFEAIKMLYERHGASPSAIQLKNEVFKIRSKNKEAYEALFQRIIRPQLKRDHAYIRDNLSKFCKKAVTWHMNNILVKNQFDDPDRVFEMVKQTIENYDTVNFEEAPIFSMDDIDAKMEESASEEMIPTFMPTIDHLLGGGVPRQTLFLTLAGTNVGKSIFLTNWTYQLVKHGFKCFVITLEGYKNQFMFRLAARALRVPYGYIKMNKLNDEQKVKLHEFKKLVKDRVQFLHNATFGQTIEDLVPIIREKKRNFDFDVLILDYGQILTSKKPFGENRHEQAYVHRGLSALAGELDMLVGSVVQGTRQTQIDNAEGRRLVRMNDVSECFEIMRTAATVLTLNRSDRDIQSERVRVLLDKQRDGVTGKMEICKTDMQTLAMYGHEEEGLGFLDAMQYAKENCEEVSNQ